MEEKMVGRFRVYREDPESVSIRGIDSFNTIRLKQVEFGNIEVGVRRDIIYFKSVVTSREALDVALDMLEGKSDVTPPEAEAKSEPETEIDPEVAEKISTCALRAYDLKFEKHVCMGEGEDSIHPECKVKTAEDLEVCKHHYISATS